MERRDRTRLVGMWNARRSNGPAAKGRVISPNLRKNITLSVQISVDLSDDSRYNRVTTNGKPMEVKLAGQVAQIIDLSTGATRSVPTPKNVETTVAEVQVPEVAADVVIETAAPTKASRQHSKGRFRDMADNSRGEKRSGEVLLLAADRFKPLGHNIRDWTLPDNIAAIRGIAASFVMTSSDPEDYIREPVVVLIGDDGMLEIEKGETRWRAVLMVEGQEFAPGMREPALVAPGTIKIPCVKGNPNRTMLQRSIEAVTQVGRRPNDLELARFFSHLHKPVAEGGEGMSQSAIAEAINKPGQQTYVSQILALLRPEVDPRLHDAMLSGRIAATTIVNTYRDFDRSGEASAKATEVMLETVAEAIAADEADAEQADVSGTKAPSRVRQPRPRRATANAINRKTAQSIVSTANPRAHTKVNYDIMHTAVEYAAQYSPSGAVRDEMNKALKKAGYHDLPCLVDAAGNELPNAAEIMEKHRKSVKRRAA